MRSFITPVFLVLLPTTALAGFTSFDPDFDGPSTIGDEPAYAPDDDFEPNLDAFHGDDFDIMAASYYVGMDCPNVAGTENRASPDTIDCCQDAGCAFSTEVESVGGETCVVDICDCGMGEAGDVVLGSDDRAFLECAEYGSEETDDGDDDDSWGDDEPIIDTWY